MLLLSKCKFQSSFELNNLKSLINDTIGYQFKFHLLHKVYVKYFKWLFIDILSKDKLRSDQFTKKVFLN